MLWRRAPYPPASRRRQATRGIDERWPGTQRRPHRCRWRRDGVHQGPGIGAGARPRGDRPQRVARLRTTTVRVAAGAPCVRLRADRSARRDRADQHVATATRRARPRSVRRRRTRVRLMATCCPNACSVSRAASNICLHPLPAGASVPTKSGRLATMSDITARSSGSSTSSPRPSATRGYPPTVREIGEAVGLTSSSSVHAQLANLERKGLLHQDADEAPGDVACRSREATARSCRCSAGSPPVPRSWPPSTSRSTSRCRMASLRRRRPFRAAGRRRLHDRRRHPRRRHVVIRSQATAATTATSWRPCCPAPPRTRPPSSGWVTTAARHADPGEPGDGAVRDDRRPDPGPVSSRSCAALP